MIAGLLAFLISPAFAGTADPTHDGEAFTFYIENDTHNLGGPGSDESYSNGFRFSYVYAEDRVPVWAKSTVEDIRILEKKVEETKANFGISLAQQIYTPNNTTETGLIADDRPYAGWLYLGLAAGFKEEKVGHFFEMDVGMIGPSALGKEVQNNFHRMIDEPQVRGWANGLRDEFTLQFFYQKRHKLVTLDYADFVPYYGAGVGNVQIAGHGGGIIRVGWNLPDDFGPSRPSASDGDSFVTPVVKSGPLRHSYYGFVGVRGNAIARNIFLDGNTFHSSHRVSKNRLTFETEFGFGVQIRPISVVWRLVTRSPEFQERDRFNSFASLNISYLL